MVLKMRTSPGPLLAARPGSQCRLLAGARLDGVAEGEALLRVVVTCPKSSFRKRAGWPIGWWICRARRVFEDVVGIYGSIHELGAFGHLELEEPGVRRGGRPSPGEGNSGWWIWSISK